MQLISPEEFARDLLELITSGQVVPAWYRGALRYFSPGHLPRGARSATLDDVLEDIKRLIEEQGNALL
ncbi:MAG: hypothetical protein NZM42_11960 [Gemmatales bacterium]|nr:hypothetical protein [Gemmatales bacterium]